MILCQHEEHLVGGWLWSGPPVISQLEEKGGRNREGQNHMGNRYHTCRVRSCLRGEIAAAPNIKPSRGLGASCPARLCPPLESHFRRYPQDGIPCLECHGQRAIVSLPLHFLCQPTSVGSHRYFKSFAQLLVLQGQCINSMTESLSPAPMPGHQPAGTCGFYVGM